MKKVQVLLSAYNGEHYIAEQINSIIHQSYPHISILIRDDGSSDRTMEVIQSLVKTYPERIAVIQGRNVGVVASFLELMQDSDPHADYYCFCDQDDVWLEHKVESALECLKPHDEKAAMVFTATRLADRALQAQGIWPKPPKRQPSFYNALVQNIAVGATITVNKSARDLFVNYPGVEHNRIIMHDWWFYLIVSAMGHVIYDSNPSMLYRQHGNNVVGGSNSVISKIRQKFRSFIKHRGKYMLRRQAEEFHRVYGHLLNKEKKSQLEMFIAPRKNVYQRVKYLRRSQLYRQSLLEQCLFKFLIISGYI